MLKRLKSLFIIEEENNTPTAPKKVEAKKKPIINDVPINKNAKSSDKFITNLLKAIESNNLEGFDYLEYKQSLKSLSQMDMDEATKFNSAFAMAKTMGANKKILIDSANHYLSILKTEESKFNDAYEKQQHKQVGIRQEKLISIESSIKKKEEQIKKLQEEIKNSKKEFELKKNEINEASAKVAQTRDEFIASYKSVSDQISNDIERMNKYLTT
ncbi:hypothetical protein GCM10007940_40200 [Portibacter lacus]|uniref:Uncharacterized protein n=2 Tax=Portibacter lacus TaxID=1099794 RepID=A0AA37STB5_9BACT|nr:hypothetical protein GCM10007940_40200 [Portibacter lacus]